MNSTHNSAARTDASGAFFAFLATIPEQHRQTAAQYLGTVGGLAYRRRIEGRDDTDREAVDMAMNLTDVPAYVDPTTEPTEAEYAAALAVVNACRIAALATPGDL